MPVERFGVICKLAVAVGITIAMQTSMMTKIILVNQKDLAKKSGKEWDIG